MTDPIMDVLTQALHGLDARQRVVGNNIANIETPGFIAKKVDFETSLQQALAAGTPTASTITTSNTSDPTLPNGNNVNLDDQTLSLMQTNLRYQTTVEGINAKFRLLRTAIGS
jgi:flagellar basal-body rod protein FlgB